MRSMEAAAPEGKQFEVEAEAGASPHWLARDPMEWILRIGVFMCFVGHGAFGLLRKPAWLDYFAALGIAPDVAMVLMPVVGSLDIMLGVAALVAPVQPVLLWAVAWGLWTALLRPIAGEPFWETLERAGNYGVALALLVWIRAGRARWALPAVSMVLQWTVVLLLLGHGGLAAAGKPLLVGHLAAVGLPPGSVEVVAWIDVALALAIAVRPALATLYMAFCWKLGTELLFPVAGAPVWEFIERGGSYAAPLALGVLLVQRSVVPVPSWTVTVRARTVAVIALLAAAAAVPAVAVAQDGSRAEGRWAEVARTVPSDGAMRHLVDELAGGGYTLLCRHAITDHGQRDRGRSRAEQRNLNHEGRAQARRWGRSIGALDVPIGEVRASPMYRTMDSAELAFGRVEADNRLRGSSQLAALLRLLAARPAAGTNRVLVSHQGTIRRVVPIGRAPLEEGDCLVLESGADSAGFAVRARVGADDWIRAERDR